MNFTDYPDANGKYNAIMSFGREQMFKDYDLALLTIGVVVLALFIEVSTSKSRARLTTIKMVDREIQQKYMNIIDQDGGAVKKRLRLQKYIELLIPDPPQHTTFSDLQPDKPLEEYYQDSHTQRSHHQTGLISILDRSVSARIKPDRSVSFQTSVEIMHKCTCFFANTKN